MKETISVEAFRATAVERARAAIAALAALGVEAVVTGSLARGGFGLHSDVDLLIRTCPPDLKYAIEGLVEDIMQEIRFDVVYLDEIPARKVAGFSAGAVGAAELC